MTNNSVNNKRIAKNTLLLYFRMFLMMGINLYTSRLILQALGVEDYGIYNIVGGVVALFSFISGAMVAATQRYLNFYIGKGDDIALRQVFNASQIIHVVVALIVILLAETIGVWFLYNEMVLPPSRLNAAFWTFQFSVIATSFVVISYPYNATIIAHEQMGAFAYVSILEAILKLLIVFLLYISPCDSLKLYGFLFMTVQIIVTLTYRIYCRRRFKETKFECKNIPKSLYKELVCFSGWNFLGNIANVCLMQGTNILLNLFFGPTVNAAKGISVQVQNAVSAFCNNFQMAQNPQIVKCYAAGETQEMHKLIFRVSRFSFYLVLLFTIPIIMKTQAILDIWLKNPPEYASVFVQYTMLFTLVQSLATPLATGSIATGNVKVIMSVIAVFFWMIIPLGYIVLKLGYSPISLFQVQLLLYIVAQFMRVIIVSKQIGFSKMYYLKKVIYPILFVSIITFPISFLISLLFSNSFVGVLSFSIACVGLSIGIIMGIGVSKHERIVILNFVKHKILKKHD